MNFLTINGKPQTHNGKFITVPDGYNNELIKVNGKLLKFGNNLIGDSVLQLSTPINLELNNTILSWNKVENAEKYAILVDGVIKAYVE